MAIDNFYSPQNGRGTI